MRKYKTILVCILAVTISGFIVGCTGAMFKNMGSFQPSRSATGNFEKFAVNKTYNYFISGSDVYPLAIFGLEKKYIIDSDEDLWKKIEPKEELLMELVSNMQSRLRGCCLVRPHGFDILDNHGAKIGEWYSMSGLIIAIKIKEEGKVVIYPPSDTEAVKKYQDRDF